MSNEAAALARTRIAYLEDLGDELRERGFAVRLTVPREGPPSLHRGVNLRVAQALRVAVPNHVLEDANILAN